MTHPNLSAGINNLIRHLNQPGNTLNLRDLQPGMLLYFRMEKPGSETTDNLEVTIKVEGPHTDDTNLCGKINDITWTGERFRGDDSVSPAKGHFCVILGGCTRNPGASLGFTMLHSGFLDKGRNLLWASGKDEQSPACRWLSAMVVADWLVKSAEQETANT